MRPEIELEPLLKSQPSDINKLDDLEEGREGSSTIVEKNKHVFQLLKLAFCFSGLQLSYLSWGIVQEHIMTHQYKNGRFISSTFLVFANRLLALIVSLIIVVFQKSSNPELSVIKDVPFYYYAPASLSNTLSSWAQYEALKYVSFPTQVLSKSCKIIPVMLVSKLIMVLLYLHPID